MDAPAFLADALSIAPVPLSLRATNVPALLYRYRSYLASLYGALYLLLHSEDNALLIGSVMLFGILAAIMVATRKVNWYALFDQTQSARTTKTAKEVWG